ncbi:MAG: hypothetical protein AB1938_14435 [Myxococcota bacterium]
MKTTLTTAVMVVVAGLLLACGPQGDLPSMREGTLRIEVPLREGAVGTLLDLRARADSMEDLSFDVTESVTWASEDPTIAAFVSANRLRFISPGTVSITATYLDQTVSTTVTVKPASARTLELLPGIEGLHDGASQQFILLAHLDDGSERDVTREAQWEFSGGLAAGSTPGEARALEAGFGALSAAWGGKAVHQRLSIRPALRSGLSVTLSESSLTPGATAEVRLGERLADGTEVDQTAATSFSSSDENVARIVLSGGRAFVRALQPGTVAVTALFAGVRQAAPLSVVAPPLAGIEFDEEFLSVPVGLERTITAFARFANGERVRLEQDLRFTAVDPSILAVDAAGRVRGLREGHTQVLVASGQLVATLEAEVTQAVVTGVSASVGHVRLAPSQHAALALVGHLSDGTSIDLTSKTTFSASGGVTAKYVGAVIEVSAAKEGQASLLLQSGGFEELVSVEVTSEELVSLTLSESADGARLIATAEWKDGVVLDVSELVTWSIDGAGLGIDQTPGHCGFLMGSGEAVFTAEWNGVTAKYALSH